MKKIVSIIIIAVMLFSFASCSGFVSSYRATMLIKDEKSDYCSATWGTLDGTLVLNSSKKSGAHEGDIHYTASLEEGELTVYYSIREMGDGQKIELFKLKGGERVDDRGGYIEMNNNIQIIIETNGETKGGSINVDLG